MTKLFVQYADRCAKKVKDVAYRMYSTLAGMWYLAPGSKSDSLRKTGGFSPCNSSRNLHHSVFKLLSVVLPSKTDQRHLSMR